ncbi:MAG TPA: CHAT domain-containing protein, partial [Chloroflexota bacterium]|nr:CHAT domain-containing protein [Chloroflexota bacterium]
ALAGLVAATFPPATRGMPGMGGTLDAALLKVARALHPVLAQLLPPFDPERPPTLVIAPTGALHRLPLHACPWPDQARGRLLDGYVVSYTTTADVLLLASQKPAARAGVAALAPGLPIARDQPPLAGSLAEACALARGAGGSLLLRGQANLATLLRERAAAGKRWVLLATHGRAGGAHAARSGLLFYDEQGAEPVWLSAAEILGRLDLEGTEHLALTACSTHADDAAPGDRLAGLLRALLYRGARSVQATLWPVRDDAALLVSAWTWEQLLAGTPDKAGALRAAVLRLRACTGQVAAAEVRRLGATLPAGDPALSDLECMAADLASQPRPFAHTAAWAPFVLHGAPRIAP